MNQKENEPEVRYGDEPNKNETNISKKMNRKSR